MIGKVIGISKTIANDLNTTEEGYVLGARQGKVLNDKINSTNDSIDLLQSTVSGISDSVETNTSDIESLKSKTIPIANNLTTTEEGLALDATQGNVLHKESVKRYIGTFTTAGWNSGDYYNSKYSYLQSVEMTPAVNGNTELGVPMIKLTENTETNDVLKSNLAIIANGHIKTDSNKVYIYVSEKPSCDLDIIFYGKDVTE